MTTYNGRRVFRNPRWVLAAVTVATLLFVQFADGRWVKLPPDGVAMANSLRAWLRAE